jgi:hypothetical protein
MIFEDVLRDMLVATNLVGRRVFLARAPQKPADQQVTPYMVFLMVAPFPLHSQGGPASLMEREYQLSVFDQSQARGLAIADSLRSALDGFSGSYEGVWFGGIFYRTQTMQYENDTMLFQFITEFRILYTMTPEALRLGTQRSTQRSKPTQFRKGVTTS